MKRSLLFLSTLLLSSACSTPEVVPDGIEVRILPGHNHTRYCGHYELEQSWYYVQNHKHAVNCGHETDDSTGTWTKTK